MLFKKLTKLANELDQRGYTKEADIVDNIIYHINIAAAPKCTCSCPVCKYGRDLGDMGRAQAALNNHKQCTTGNCEVAKSL